MILERSGGFGVRFYAGGRQVWGGTYPTREMAERVHAAGLSSECREAVCEEARRLRDERLSQTEAAARKRAVNMYPAEPCEVCGEVEIQRHHRDGQPTNNVRENIVFLCHRHHRAAHSLGGRTWVCRSCGAQAVHLHHAIPRSVCRATKLDLRNGLPLCRSCHVRWHEKTLTIYRDVFTEDEWAYISSVELTGQRIEAWLDDHYPERTNERLAA